MDTVNRSFYLTRLVPTVTAQRIRTLLRGVNDDGELFVTDDTVIMVFPPGEYNTTVNAIVTGVNLSIREIEHRLRGQMIDRSPFFIRYPNYGVEKDDRGNILHSRFQAQVRLMEANGFLRPVDIFTDKFIGQYGDYFDLTNVAHLHGVKELWRLRNDATTVDEIHRLGLLKYGSTINPYEHDYHNLNRGEDEGHTPYDTTELWFASRIECLQAIKRFNNNQDFVRNGNRGLLPRFLTRSPPELFCNLDEPHTNLGLDGMRIVPRDFPHFVVPLSYLVHISDEKVRSFEFQCPICKATVKVKHVDGDLGWLSGTCKCETEDLKDRGLIHGDEPFMRVAKHRFNQNRPFALMQALLPTYASVEECVSREIPALYEEYRLGREELLAARATFTFVEHWFRETVQIDNKQCDIYVGMTTLPKSKTWSVGGFSSMERATFNRVVADGEQPIGQPFRGKVMDIADIDGDEDHVEVWFEFFLPQGSAFDAQGEFQITPRPPVGMTERIAKAYSTWENNVDLCTTIYMDFAGYITNMRNRGEWSKTKENVWIADVILASSPTTTEIRRHLAQGYVGLNTAITVEENGVQKVYKDFARVVRIVDSEDALHATLTIVFPLRKSITISDCAAFTCKMWAYEKEADPLEKPGKKTDIQEIMKNDELWEDEVSSNDDADGSDYDDEEYGGVIRDGDELYRRRRQRARDQENRARNNDDGAPFGYCLSHRLSTSPWRITRNSTPDQLMGFIKGSPIPDISFGNLLLHEQNITPLDCLRKPIPPPAKGGFISMLRERVNDSQYAAIKKMLLYRSSIVQGPPGTGKTLTAAIGVCALHCKESGYLIVTGPTNKSVDVLFAKIMEINQELNIKMNVLRMVAHSKERRYTAADPNTDQYLHIALENDPSYIEYRQGLAEEENQNNGGVANNAHGGVHQRRAQRAADRLAKMYYGARMLTKADVILCTVPMINDPRITGMQRRLVDTDRKLIAILCDESSMLTAPQTIPMLGLGGRRLILLGDICQLNAVVRSPAVKLACFDLSWMERLAMTDLIQTNNLFTLLDIQYRSEEIIGRITSNYMYEGRVNPSQEVTERHAMYRRLRAQLNMPELRRGHNVVYTYNRRDSELQDPGSSSRYNLAEVFMVKNLAIRLRDRGIPLNTVGVIAMYDRQVTEIRNTLLAVGPEFRQVSISTVDSCQGEEFDYVIISMVRSNTESNIGFIREMNRVNVSISRARHFQFFVCNMATMINCREKSIQDLIREWRRYQISVVTQKVTRNSVEDLNDTDMDTYLRAHR